MSKELSPDTKFTLSIQTMIGAGMGIASLVGMWYMLQADIQEAKELPTLESLYESEYPSKPQGYNHPASFEQYKSQVGGLQEDMDELYDISSKLQEDIDDLKQRVMELRLKIK
jgi:hypothetical protein